MTGVETKGAQLRAEDEGPAGDEPTLEVELAHARWRHFAWALVGIGLGGLIVWGLEAAGRVLGLLILAGGLWAAWSFVRTLRNPAGVISLRAEEIVLPPRLCAGTTVTLPLADVRHAYLLKRALPWTTSGPVLVVETSRGIFSYPRDWFAADSDQRRLFTSLNRRLGRI